MLALLAHLREGAELRLSSLDAYELLSHDRGVLEHGGLGPQYKESIRGHIFPIARAVARAGEQRLDPRYAELFETSLASTKMRYEQDYMQAREPPFAEACLIGLGRDPGEWEVVANYRAARAAFETMFAEWMRSAHPLQTELTTIYRANPDRHYDTDETRALKARMGRVPAGGVAPGLCRSARRPGCQSNAPRQLSQCEDNAIAKEQHDAPVDT